MSRNVLERFAELPGFLSGHLLLSISALLVGLMISLPLGILASRSDRARGPVLAVASLVQTIPSLALLALMVPLLGGLIGFIPAFMALTLYSILPTLRNTVTGIAELDPAIIEAANGVGMTESQRLWRVELPLAAPVIVAGFRTATVWVVGTATLSTPVGAPSLGNYIFAGLQTRNWVSVIFGCIFAAGLAIILDQIIRLLEVSLRDRRRKLAWGAVTLLVAVVVAGLMPLISQALTTSGGSGVVTASVAPEERTAGKGQRLLGQTVVVGSKSFTEQYVLSGLLRLRLEAEGAVVETLPNLGSTIAFDALRNNTIDVYPDYTGTVWSTIMNRDAPTTRTRTSIEVAHYLLETHGILSVASLGFENNYGFAMTRERAAELGVRTIADLAVHGSDITIGGDIELFSRPEWIRVRDTYGLHDAATLSMDSTFMYDAVVSGEVDVISAYTTDGRIAAFDLQILGDPRVGFPPYDAILIMSPAAQAKPGLVEVLTEFSWTITDTLMREANRLVDLDGQSPGEAASYLYEAIWVEAKQ